MKKFATFAFIFLSIIYLLSSGKPTNYDYFNRLSKSFLSGKYTLTEKHPWLNELIPLKQGGYTFVNPPMPAFLGILPNMIFGNSFKQDYLAYLLGAGSAVTIALIAFNITKSKQLSLWFGSLVGLGSIVWFLSTVGSVWYLGQLTALFFTIFAIYESVTKKRPFVVGLLLSFAILSRLQIILSLPFFIYEISKIKIKHRFILFGLGVALSVLVYGLYNWVRFNDAFQTGYRLIPGLLDEPWFANGQFSLRYIPKHLSLLLLGSPKFSNEFPYIYPSLSGLSILLTTPAFVYLANTLKPTKDYLALWSAVLFIGLVNFSYGSTGFTQFGYRYAVDFYPFLFLLLIKYFSKNKLKRHHWILLLLAIVVNLWGVIFINKFDWVIF